MVAKCIPQDICVEMFRAVNKISVEKKAFLILHAGTKKLDNFRKPICANQG